MTTATSIITAEFSSFEDFSSRMILLPLHDDECTGARVESHVVLPTAASVVDIDAASSSVSSNFERIEVVAEGKETRNDSEPAADEAISISAVHVATTAVEKDSEKLVNVAQDVEEEVIEGNDSMNFNNSDPTVIACVEHHECGEGTRSQTQVPVGYVLVKINTRDNGGNPDMAEELENMEFTVILTFLRESVFPLSLEFAPPNACFDEGDEEYISPHIKTTSSDVLEFDGEPSNNDDEFARTDANINESSLPLSTMVSRDDAAKFAKQAATELRGRLSRWGYQAATLAVDAAAQVKELRDERQRKLNDEHQDRDHGNQSDIISSVAGALCDDTNDDILLASATKKLLDVDEVTERHAAMQTNNTGPCSIFIQTSSGFDRIEAGNVVPVTNTTVISVRLSEDEACPIGKTGYTFQWFRSKSDVGITNTHSQQSVEEGSKDDAQSWTALRGACYAAYQPCCSDVGHYLRCIVNCVDDVLQSCILPSRVTMEQSQLDYALTSLLGGSKSTSFGPLQGVDGVTMYRIKIHIVTHGDFISNSAIYIDATTHDAVDKVANGMEPVLHFSVEVDPAMPRRLELFSASHGCLKLDAANRKTRELLVLALGLANFRGTLSSLTTATALIPSFEYDDLVVDAEEESSVSIKHIQQPDVKTTEINRLLQSKDYTISKLRHELMASHDQKRQLEEAVQQCRDIEQVFKPQLEKYKATATELKQSIEDITHSHNHANAAQEKAIKSLNNEKVVLLAAVEARDGKIDGLNKQVSDLAKKISLQSEKLSTIESLRHDLRQAQDKYTSAEKRIAELSSQEIDLQHELTSATEKVSMLESDCGQLKKVASKIESDFKKLKAERNSLKARADSLSKEMLRISKLNSDNSEVEKLSKLIHELRISNTNLMEQFEASKLEKRRILDTLDATCMAHQQSVRFQMLSSEEARTGTHVPEARVRELERVVTSMTEHLDAKDMQIETLKQINKALLEGK
jgi:hypothetical protein